jgi:hypothetical protein
MIQKIQALYRALCAVIFSHFAQEHTARVTQTIADIRHELSAALNVAQTGMETNLRRRADDAERRIDCIEQRLFPMRGNVVDMNTNSFGHSVRK